MVDSVKYSFGLFWLGMTIRVGSLAAMPTCGNYMGIVRFSHVCREAGKVGPLPALRRPDDHLRTEV